MAAGALALGTFESELGSTLVTRRTFCAHTSDCRVILCKSAWRRQPQDHFCPFNGKAIDAGVNRGSSGRVLGNPHDQSGKFNPRNFHHRFRTHAKVPAIPVKRAGFDQSIVISLLFGLTQRIAMSDPALKQQRIAKSTRQETS
jgi:hypothetical protein